MNAASHLIAQIEELEAGRDGKFEALVAEVAAGKEVSPKDAQTILRETGKSVDDLDEAVLMIQLQKDAAASLEIEADLIERLEEIELTFSAAKKKRDDAAAEYEALAAPLSRERSTISDSQRRLWVDRHVRLCDYARAIGGEDDLFRRIKGLCNAIESITADIKSGKIPEEKRPEEMSLRRSLLKTLHELESPLAVR